MRDDWTLRSPIDSKFAREADRRAKSGRPLSEQVRAAICGHSGIVPVPKVTYFKWLDEIAALEAELADCEYQRQQAVRLNVKNAKVIRALEGGDG